MAKTKRQKTKKAATMVSARKRAERRSQGFERTTLKAPDGTNFYSVKKEGTRRIEILPYTVGNGNPNADKGDMYFERTFWVHRGIGPDNNSYVCSAKTFKKKCPICEARAKLMAKPNYDEDQVAALAPKERQLYLVYDHSESDKGVQIWDISYFLFGKKLDATIKNSEEDDGYEYFADPEKGKTLRIGFEEKSFGGNSYCEVTAIDFKDRKDDLPDEVTGHEICLDDCLIETPYKELKEIFLQVDEEDEDEDEDDKKKSKKSKSKKKDDDDEDEEEEEEEEEDDSDDEDDDDEDEEEDDDEEEEEKPKKSKKKPAKKSKKKDDDEDEEEEEDEEEDNDDDEEDEDDEDEEEEEEKPKKKSKKSPPAKKSKKKKDDDEDEDDDDLPFDDDEDDDD